MDGPRRMEGRERDSRVKEDGGWRGVGGMEGCDRK